MVRDNSTAPRPRGTVAGAYRQALTTGLRPVAASRHLTTAWKGLVFVWPSKGGRQKLALFRAAVEAPTRMTYKQEHALVALAANPLTRTRAWPTGRSKSQTGRRAWVF